MIIAEKYEYTFPHLTEEEIKNAEMCLNHIFRVHFDGSTLPYEVRQILLKMALDEIAANTQCGRLNEDCIKDTVYHMDMFSANGNLTQIKVVAELILDMEQLKNKRCTNYRSYIYASNPCPGDYVNISEMSISYAALDVTITDWNELQRIIGYFDYLKKNE